MSPPQIFAVKEACSTSNSTDFSVSTSSCFELNGFFGAYPFEDTTDGALGIDFSSRLA